MRADFRVSVAMTSTEVTVDRIAVEDSFRVWQEEQSLLDAQLAESVAALEAYQSHLDVWQQDLARERQQLQEEREAFNRDCSSTGSNLEQLQVLTAQLDESREKNNSLTAALLQRTEELRSLDQQFAVERQQWEHESARLSELAEKGAAAGASASPLLSLRNGPVKSEPRTSTSPVLGSVMEQFGKLRQQRSLNRPNPNPKPR